MKTESDTPRTDAETMRDEYDHVDTEFGPFALSVTVGVDFARQLERELVEVTNQRDALIEGLEKLASCDWVITLPDRMDAVREIARNTIKAAEENQTNKMPDCQKSFINHVVESIKEHYDRNFIPYTYLIKSENKINDINPKGGEH